MDTATELLLQVLNKITRNNSVISWKLIGPKYGPNLDLNLDYIWCTETFEVSLTNV